MTAVEWVVEQVEDFIGLIPVDIIEQAKEMEKQMVIDIIEKSRATGLTAEYLLLTYGSKGIDTPHVTPQVTPQVTSQTEISDEEIENYLAEAGHPLSYDNAFIDGAKWYREQLKRQYGKQHFNKPRKRQ